jgi:hypothetical protein
MTRSANVLREARERLAAFHSDRGKVKAESGKVVELKH